MNVYEHNSKRELKYRRRTEALEEPVRRTLVIEHSTDEAIIHASAKWGMSYSKAVEQMCLHYLQER